MSKNNTNGKLVAISTVDATNVTCAAPAGTLLKSTGSQVSSLGNQGTAGQALVSNGPNADPVWSSLTTLGTNVDVGGTNGQILLTDGAGIKRLTTQGTSGQTLVSNGAGADPSWTTQTTTLTNVSSAGSTNRIIYSDGTNLQALPNPTGFFNKVLTAFGNGTPTWNIMTVQIQDIVASGGVLQGKQFLYANSQTPGQNKLEIIMPTPGYLYWDSGTGDHQYNQYIDAPSTVQSTTAGVGSIGVFKGANKTLTALGQGTSGQILTSNGTGADPSWNSTLNLSAVATTSANGSLAASDGTKLVALGQGTTNQVLISNGAGNTPSWGNISSGSVGLVGTAGTLVKTNGSTPALLSSQGTSGQALLSQGAGADPTWGTPNVGLSNITSGGTNSNIMYSDGTNPALLSNPGADSFLTYTGAALAWASSIPQSICTQPTVWHLENTGGHGAAYTTHILSAAQFANVVYAEIIVVAGGGSGGNCASTTSTRSAGGGGGGSTWCKRVLRRSNWPEYGDAPDGLEIRVGAGASRFGGQNGLASGGNSFVKSEHAGTWLLEAGGGSNGFNAGASQVGENGTGGSIGGNVGTILYSDFCGGGENGFDANDIMGWTGGRGGGTPRGRGGGERPYNIRGGGDGYDAVGYGGGGGGAVGYDGQAYTGGRGGHGFVSIVVYYQ